MLQLISFILLCFAQNWGYIYFYCKLQLNNYKYGNGANSSVWGLYPASVTYTDCEVYKESNKFFSIKLKM